MTTSVSGRNLADALEVVTKPIYLVELGFSPVVRISTAGSIVWNGFHWQAAPVTVSSIDNTSLGGQQATLRFANQDRVWGALVLSQVAQDRPVKIWLAYRDLSMSDPMLFCDGMMDGASVGEAVVLNVIARSTAYGSTPRLLCGPPLMNHLPPAGTELKAGSVTIKLEPR